MPDRLPDSNGACERRRMQVHAAFTSREADERIFSRMCPAIAFMKSGGTQLPIWRIPSSNAPANANASGKDPKRLNSGSENRRRASQCIAPCMPRFTSFRRIVRAQKPGTLTGFVGSVAA